MIDLVKPVFSALVFTLVCFFVLTGCGAAPEATPAVVVSAEIKLGMQTFTDHCAICHALTPDTIVRGPSLHKIGIRANSRVASQDASAYLYNSIMRPSDFLVEDFEDIMPTTLAKDLTGEELDAVVAYLLTLK